MCSSVTFYSFEFFIWFLLCRVKLLSFKQLAAKASKTESPAGKKKFVNKQNDKKKGKDSSKPLEKDTAKSRRERKQAR